MIPGLNFIYPHKSKGIEKLKHFQFICRSSFEGQVTTLLVQLAWTLGNLSSFNQDNGPTAR